MCVIALIDYQANYEPASEDHTSFSSDISCRFQPHPHFRGTPTSRRRRPTTSSPTLGMSGANCNPSPSIYGAAASQLDHHSPVDKSCDLRIDQKIIGKWTTMYVWSIWDDTEIHFMVYGFCCVSLMFLCFHVDTRSSYYQRIVISRLIRRSYEKLIFGFIMVS